MTTATDLVLGSRSPAERSAPLVTHYDREVGSRVELSVTSTANWAAKIAGLLRDEVGVAPGDEVLVDLPLHWLTPAVLLGAWWAGAHVVTPDGLGASTAPVAVVTVVDRLDRHGSTAEALAMSTDPMGRDLGAAGVDPPVGVIDLVGACRIHPDDFTPAGPAGACLDGRTADESAGGEGGRLLLVDDGGDPLPRIARGFLSGASLVLVGPAGEEPALDDLAATEHVTGYV